MCLKHSEFILSSSDTLVTFRHVIRDTMLGWHRAQLTPQLAAYFKKARKTNSLMVRMPIAIDCVFTLPDLIIERIWYFSVKEYQPK